jgi:glycosyltransferase involved in cell wall biosynthesis
MSSAFNSHYYINTNKRSLDDMNLALKKAKECGSNAIEIDASHLFLIEIKNSFLSALKLENIPLIIQIDFNRLDLMSILYSMYSNCILNFVISKDLDQNQINLITHRMRHSPHNYFTLRSSKKINTLDLIEKMPQFMRDRLYFEFRPYHPTDTDQYTTYEIYKLIEKIQIRFPDLPIRPSRGLDFYDDRIPDSMEIEHNEAPLFEFRIENSKIQNSIIIPTYNSKYFLLNVVRHLIQQNYNKTNFEIIIVDDGSNDNSAAYLQSYLATSPNQINLKYIYWKKDLQYSRGDFGYRAGAARNIGVKNSSGQNLIFLDSDILVPESFLNEIDLHLSKNDVIQFVRRHLSPKFSLANANYNNIDLKSQSYIEDAKYWNQFFNSDSWQALDRFWKYTCSYCLAMTKENFFAAGRFRRTFLWYGFEDTDLGYKLFKMKKRFYLCQTSVLHLTPSHENKDYTRAKIARQLTLAKTAKIFYLNHLDPDIYEHLHGYMFDFFGLERRLRKYYHFLLGRFEKK